MHAGGGVVQGDSLLGDIPSGRMDRPGDVNLRRVMRILGPSSSLKRTSGYEYCPVLGVGAQTVESEIFTWVRYEVVSVKTQ